MQKILYEMMGVGEERVGLVFFSAFFMYGIFLFFVKTFLFFPTLLPRDLMTQRAPLPLRCADDTTFVDTIHRLSFSLSLSLFFLLVAATGCREQGDPKRGMVRVAASIRRALLACHIIKRHWVEWSKRHELDEL